MRISVILLGAGAAALAAVPVLPQSWVPDAIYAPAGRVVPVVVDSGAAAIGNFIATAAQAAETDKPAIDFSKLVRVGDDAYKVTMGPEVSTEVLSNVTVKKIGLGGRVTRVNIVTTPTGTYSTDAIASSHVLYPGITATRSGEQALDQSAAAAFTAFWRTGFGWAKLPVNPHGSIVEYGQMNGGGHYLSANGRTCFSGPGYTTCG